MLVINEYLNTFTSDKHSWWVYTFLSSVQNLWTLFCQYFDYNWPDSIILYTWELDAYTVPLHAQQLPRPLNLFKTIWDSVVEVLPPIKYILVWILSPSEYCQRHGKGSPEKRKNSATDTKNYLSRTIRPHTIYLFSTHLCWGQLKKKTTNL